jgi:Zn-dependent protease/CBS domain-containing protein
LGKSIGIGSYRGVSIKVHPTFALLLIWIVYQWGISANAGIPGVIFGTLVLLAVFGCVLAHELAHAVVAMRYGLAVHDITLLPIGGVARIEHASLTPRSETWIALAGPLVNIAIALALTPVVVLVAMARNVNQAIGVLLYADEISIAGFILYLWIANILLAVFNLLPAFPMDGGRVLRALLSIRRSRLAATRIAVYAGQSFAVLLAVLGIWAGDFLLPLVAVFILISAQIEMRHIEIESALRVLPVGQFALWEAGGISPDVPLSHATRGGPRDIVVTRDNRVVGMLWRHELLHHLSGSQRDLHVRDVMDRSVHPAEGADSVYDVHLWLHDSNRSAIPVIDNGEYRGIFTVDRLAHVYQVIEDRNRTWQIGILLAFWNRVRLVGR